MNQQNPNQPPLDPNDVTVDVVHQTSLESISRAEIDIAISTARRFPRELSTVKKNMLSFATLDVETAASCFYTVPRGGKNIQGPSVRLAEIAVSSYQNIRAGSRILQTVVDGPNPHVVVQAVAMDLEKNVSVSIEKRRRITGKKIWQGGQHVGNKPPDEDDINLAANAGSAIAFRDAVFKVIPLALIKPVFEEAKKVAIGDAKTLSTRRANCVEQFGKMGVGPDRILAKLEKKSMEDVGLEDIEILIGLFNAIRDGEVQIDDVLPAPTAATKKPEFATAGATAAPAQTKKPEPQIQKPAEPAAQTAAPEPAKTAEPAAPVVNEPVQAPAQTAQTAAPVTAPQAAEPQPVSPPPQNAPVATPAATGGSEAMTGLRALMTKDGVNERQVASFCEKKKILKAGQKFTDLSDAKLNSISKAWNNVIAGIKAEPA